MNQLNESVNEMNNVQVRSEIRIKAQKHNSFEEITYLTNLNIKVMCGPDLKVHLLNQCMLASCTAARIDALS